ncbi:MAG: hypothetical protein MJE66_03175 [Proteobacteria bacterium]|nr:hypothetical protein [Pseudomonadota bacterium]
MTLRQQWTTALGLLALGWVLALTGPGVKLARADGDPAEFDRFLAHVDQPAQAAAPVARIPVAAASASCDATRQASHQVTLQQAMLQMRQRIAALQAEAAKDPEKRGVVMLNNRGYNYGPPPGIDPALLQ